MSNIQTKYKEFSKNVEEYKHKINQEILDFKNYALTIINKELSKIGFTKASEDTYNTKNGPYLYLRNTSESGVQFSMGFRDKGVFDLYYISYYFGHDIKSFINEVESKSNRLRGYRKRIEDFEDKLIKNGFEKFKFKNSFDESSTRLFFGDFVIELRFIKRLYMLVEIKGKMTDFFKKKYKGDLNINKIISHLKNKDLYYKEIGIRKFGNVEEFTNKLKEDQEILDGLLIADKFGL